MTYTPTDTDNDGVVDVPVNNDSVVTEVLNDNIYPASTFATGGSGTDTDPYIDGIQEAFDKANSDGRRIVRVEIDGEFDLTSQVNPSAFYHWEIVGTGNFNYIKGPGTSPAFLVDKEVHSPQFRNFRALNEGGQNPFVKFDVGGIGNFVEPWFSWIEFDRNWRAIQIDVDGTDDAGLLEVSNCWFHLGDSNEPGDYYVYQSSTNGGEFRQVNIENCTFWLGTGNTSDDLQGGVNLENVALHVAFKDNILRNVGTKAVLKATNTDGAADQPDATIQGNAADSGSAATADHNERMFEFGNGGVISIRDNIVRGGSDSCLGFVDIAACKRYEIGGNVITDGVFSGDVLNIDNASVTNAADIGYQGVVSSRSFNSWFTNLKARPIHVIASFSASSDGTVANVLMDVADSESTRTTDAFRGNMDNNAIRSVQGVVPPNHSYQIRAFGDTGTYSIDTWRELEI